MNFPSPALVLVTDPSERLDEIVDAAITGGVNIVQLRDKASNPEQMLNWAKRLRAITAGRALLVVNGDAQTALDTGADGVQLPENGRSIALARRILGKNALVGRSVHSVDSAVRAEQEGAYYLIAGTIFISSSHPGESPKGLGFLRDVCEAVTIPVIAIGGITPENAGDCLASGALGVAVLSSIIQAKDPRIAAEQYCTALLPSSRPMGKGSGVGAL